MSTILLGINASGEILGSTGISFIYSAGLFTAIAIPDAPAGAAAAINDSGQIAGNYTDGTGTHGFVDANGAITVIDDPDATVTSPGGTPTTATEATGIDNSGQVVGIFFQSGDWDSFLYSNGSFATITVPSPEGVAPIDTTWATGINNPGDVVGYYQDSTGTFYGFLDESGTFTTITDPLAVTGTLGSGTLASGINDTGVIVGRYEDAAGLEHGFADSGATFTTIDAPGAAVTLPRGDATGGAGTYVTGINGSGVLVGFYVDSANVQHGFEATPDAGAPAGYDFTTIDAPPSLAPPPPPPPPGPCFRAGTNIATVRGEVAIEYLDIGDSLPAHFAAFAEVRWIGRRRIDCRRHPNPEAVWPVRVAAGAFRDAVPHRDLFLSPDHAVFVDQVLIPIKYLINGTSIAQTPVDEVTYYHVELDGHDVLLAEGLPAESYLETGDRRAFSNCEGPVSLFPDFTSRASDTSTVWSARGCAPLVIIGPVLEAVRRRLNARPAAVALRNYCIPHVRRRRIR